MSRTGLWLGLAGAAGAAAVGVATIMPRSGSAPVVVAQARLAPIYGYDVVREYPHDAEAFTQGLLVRDGVFYESTGLEGRSSLRKVDIETGRVLQRRAVDVPYFAEGLTDWKGELLQLTYTTEVGFVYDLSSFEPKGRFAYQGQGWGLTHDESRLIMSDGSSELRFLDPVTRREQGRVRVRDGGRPIENLNELEMVKGQVYANIWHTDRIAVIDPGTGDVRSWIDLTGLRPAAADHPEAVLNGIAYDAARDRLFVTGKWWPRVFEIRVRAGAPR